MKKLFGMLVGIMASVVLVSGIVNAQTVDTRAVMESFKKSIQQNNNKITINTVDPMLNIAEGNIEGYRGFNVSGTAPSGVQTSFTDIWDRADATPTQSEYTAPTTARLHNIVSSSVNDDGDPVGTGAQTVRVTGLTNWNSGEVFETVIMNGTSNVSTLQAYVIINNLEAITYGASGPNVGAITATAASDATVSAVMLAGEGKSHNAVYGIPSSAKAYIKQWNGSINQSSGLAAHIDFSLRINEYSDTELTSFRVEETRGLQSTGTSSAVWQFSPYLVVDGPAIIKASGRASMNDIGASAGFRGILVDNTVTTPQNLLDSSGRFLLDSYGRFLLLN